MGDTGQICILGGINEDGSYFEGKYTKIIIQTVQKLGLPDPKILFRVSKTMPDDLWRKIVDTMSSNVGSPLISNDDWLFRIWLNLVTKEKMLVIILHLLVGNQ